MIGPEQPNGEHIPAATLHSDMGCDIYAFPVGAGDGKRPLKCEASDEEKAVAQEDHAWWQATLGPFYRCRGTLHGHVASRMGMSHAACVCRVSHAAWACVAAPPAH